MKNPTITIKQDIDENRITVTLPDRSEVEFYFAKFLSIFRSGGGCKVRLYNKTRKELGDWRTGWRLHAERSMHEITIKLYDSQEHTYGSARFDIEDYAVRAPLGLPFPCVWEANVVL